MIGTHGEEREAGTEAARTTLPELTPWREVGWIFRDGSCVAIERRGDETRSRVLVD
jgi:hypothetical protein